MASSSCQLCETRKAKRDCPAVRGEICSQCCGKEREETVDCPLDCEFLLEARRHEKPQVVDEKNLPNTDVRVTDEFLRSNDELLGAIGAALLEGALETAAIDADMQECLDAAIRTLRTRESGLVYETRPSSAYAAAVQERVSMRIEGFRAFRQRQTGLSSVRDMDVLGILVFFQRVSLHLNNGRRRGRAFIDFLRERFQDVGFQGPDAPSSDLAMPGAAGGGSLIL